MTKAPTLGELLKQGSATLNKLRKDGKLKADFTGSTLVRVFCANADLAGLELTGSEWERCELSKVVFRDADLSNAYFHGGRLDDCDFTGANLEGATFEKVKLTRCDFTGARGLDELELTDVVTNDVLGLEEDEDLDDDDEPADKIVYLQSKLPKGFRRLPLEALLAEVGKIVKVELAGDKASEADIAALERDFGTTFPADYRAFLARVGGVKITGSVRHEPGAIEVFGASALSRAREQYLGELARRGFDAAWLEARAPGKPASSLGQRRAALRDALKLGDAHVKRCFGDRHDALRVAYEFMFPIMSVPGELADSVECVGPDAQLYTVSIARAEVEPPTGTFTSRLSEHMESLVVDV